MQSSNLHQMRSSPIAWCDENSERDGYFGLGTRQQSLHSRAGSVSGRNVSHRLQMDWIRSIGRSIQQSARIQCLATEIVRSSEFVGTRSMYESQALSSGGSRGFQSHRRQTVQNSTFSQRRAPQRRQRAWASINEGLEEQHRDRLQQLRDMAVEYQPPELPIERPVTPCLLSDAIFEQLKEELVSSNLPQIHAPAEPGVTVTDGCGICLEFYKPHQRRKELPCGHCFHRECLWTWFQRKPTCPTCRFDCFVPLHG